MSKDNKVEVTVNEDVLRSFILQGTPEAIIERYMQLPSLAENSDFGEFDQNIVVLDTETTGFSLNHDELTQIAAAKLNKGEITDWFITFVNPGKPIPEDVVHLTHIHDEDVVNAPLPMDALAQLVEFVGDAKIVAHNAEFDRNFTTKHPTGYPLLENTWIDSLDLARIALPRMKSHRLIDLVRAFGAPLSTHRADDDVAATCALYRLLLAAVDSMPNELIYEIAHMSTNDHWSTSVVFEYFIARHMEASGGTLPSAFSLRSLRRARVDSVEYKAKRDALVIATAALNPQSNESLIFPTEEEIDTAFSSGGIVGALYEDYETRKEQLLMAQIIRKSFSQSDNLMVEAGTGVGKSMAYLVPSALLALKNNITVGVATKTNALLDQLLYRELPALAQALCEQHSGDHMLTYAALKGFSHYPCLRKVNRLVEEGATMRKVGNSEYSQAPALAALLSYIEQTEYDDIDSLKIDYRILPRWVITTTSHDCLRRKCPFYGTSCFVHGSRRKAEAADIVVTNHSLLFCDLAADGGLLPPVRFWTIDEAHGAENEARRAFSLEISTDEITNLIQRVSADESKKNTFIRAERIIVLDSENANTLFYALTNKAKTAGREFATAAYELTSHIGDLLFFDPTTKKNKGYEFVDLWINDEIRRSSVFQTLSGYGKTLIERSEKLITVSQELVGYLEDVPHAAVIQREIASIAIELKELIRAIETILIDGSDEYVYSATLCKKPERGGSKLEASLYSVGAAMNETLYTNTFSAVFASATLTVDGSFNSFETALGLNQEEQSRCATLLLDSSYDFDNQMTIYVANDVPEPTDPQYLSQLQDLLTQAHIAQEGSFLTLFTNRREMENCFEAVNPVLREHNLRLVCQKWGVSVKGLRDDFIKDEHLSLFALKSFWEGFDAPGSTLKGVIIPKLPFAKPTDPLSCERGARDDQAWRKYVLPAAVLEIKQAAGRLIRKATDSGVLILADKRLITKSYGKAFLRSLPSKNIKICSMAEIVEDLRKQK